MYGLRSTAYSNCSIRAVQRRKALSRSRNHTSLDQKTTIAHTMHAAY